jgi:hypothetical protein
VLNFALKPLSTKTVFACHALISAVSALTRTLVQDVNFLEFFNLTSYAELKLALTPQFLLMKNA